MPKLSEDTLKKRFTCPHCGESLRTRQGLSGHIQFKHQDSQGNADAYVKNVEVLVRRVKVWKAMTYGAGEPLPKQIREQGMNILQRWLILLGYFHKLNIELSDNEFKNFFIQNFGTSGSILEQDTLLALKALELEGPKS